MYLWVQKWHPYFSVCMWLCHGEKTNFYWEQAESSKTTKIKRGKLPGSQENMVHFEGWVLCKVNKQQTCVLIQEQWNALRSGPPLNVGFMYGSQGTFRILWMCSHLALAITTCDKWKCMLMIRREQQISGSAHYKSELCAQYELPYSGQPLKETLNLQGV